MNKTSKSKSRVLILFSIVFYCTLITFVPTIARADPQPIENASMTIGIGQEPNEIDPLLVWGGVAEDVVDQVVETLFAYNLSDPELSIIPRLASGHGTWSSDNLNYTVSLRTGIAFHDGAPFNGSSVYSSFLRLFWFMNMTGELPAGERIPVADSLYRWGDGTPIIENIEMVGLYTLKFVLSRPFAALEGLLAFSGSGIVSMKSTPYRDYLDPYSDVLVGTGPYVYDYYSNNFLVQMHAFDDYWGGETVIKDLYFRVIEDPQERSDALQNGEIDILIDPLSSMLDTFRADPYIVVEEGLGMVSRYLYMNNQEINKTMRQSISYAINYSYIIDEVFEGEGARLRSPIPEGILYANWSFDVADFDILRARQILVDNGVCNYGIYDDTVWLDNPILTYTYSELMGNLRMSQIGDLLESDLPLIGINVAREVLDWSQFSDKLFNTQDMELFCLGFGPDYNDPSNYLNTQFSADGPYNYIHVNDPQLEDMMQQGLDETDPLLREAIYDDIQQYMVEDLMPVAYLLVQAKYDVYSINIYGYQSNPMGKIWVHGMTVYDNISPVSSIYLIDSVWSFDGYYMSEVTVLLEAEDDLSGINKTEYSFNGVDWIEYTDQFTVSESTYLYYRSIDNAGNIESYKMEYIDIRDRPEDHPVVIYVPNSLPYVIDPINTWGGDSEDVIDQVAETLFANDLDDSNNNIIPRLATDFGIWSPDGLRYTVPLRSGITFHDGTPLDAWAVQWNFDRLFYFMNISGSLPPDMPIAVADAVYRWSDGTPIIDSTEVVDPNTITFVLNRPFAAIDALLSFCSSAILSPSSTPATYYIDPEIDSLIGTGPFMFTEYQRLQGIKFNRYENYWQGPAEITELWFLHIEHDHVKINALQQGIVDFLDDPILTMYDDLVANPDIIVDGGPDATMYWFGMNNQKINQTMRQAISYAINYTYILEEIYGGFTTRLRSPFPLGVRYANWSYDVAEFDVLEARQILVDGGVCNYDINDDSLWINNPILSYKFTYLYYSVTYVKLANLIDRNLEKIGINIELDPVDWSDIIERISYDRDSLDLHYFGWMPDYNDPVAFIINLLDDEALNNGAQVDDSYLQSLIDQGYEETNPVLRKQIYWEIQRYCVEELMPWAFVTTRFNYIAYNSRFSGYQWNELDEVWFYTVESPDITPPETYIEMSGALTFNGYYLTDVSVHFYADDLDSGVFYTNYSFDGVNWITYDYNNVIISDEGTTTIYFRSVDFAGNVEDTKSEIIEIQRRAEDDPTVILGINNDPPELDPHNSWFTETVQVFDQVLETLFACQLDDPQMSIIPRLADGFGTWSPDGLTFTVPLKQGIMFHDGTPFDAWAVQWNFERLFYFMNYTGTLPGDIQLSMTNALYRWPDGTPIIDRVNVIGPYEVQFVLNRPYGALDALLSFSASSILSPSPTSTPQFRYLDLSTDSLVGTGPFVFDEYIQRLGLRFHSYEDYWQGQAMIPDLWFLIIQDYNLRSNALISGAIDFIIDPLNWNLETYQADPDITVEGGKGDTIYYVGMNNNKINQTMRQSLSYAFNYTYMVEEIYGGIYERLEGIMSDTLRFGDWSFETPYMDILQARQILVDAGVVNWDINNDIMWTDAAHTNPIATYNYAQIFGSATAQNIGLLLESNFEKIGIAITFELLEWSEYLDRFYNDPDSIDLFYFGWVPNFNDPSEYINWLLWDDRPDSNWVQAYDTYLQNLIDQGIGETHQASRELIYKEIQRYCVEELMPWISMVVNVQFDAYNSRFEGHQWNPMDKVYFYTVLPPDDVPPETEINLRGILGFDGWYLSDVSVEFWANDARSGVAYTQYSFDEFSWTTFTGEPVLISDEGSTTIYYRSMDNKGNLEDTKSVVIEIHSRPLNDPMVIYGIGGFSGNFDPHDAWDLEAYNVFHQVVETLFFYNLSDPSCPIIPRLADGYGTWSPDSLTFTVSIKPGITFHDGTPLDANAVKWSFDRLAYFMNVTGTLPIDQKKTAFESLYRWSDGTPIIDRVYVTDLYEVQFVLNRPFAAFEALLTFTGSSILSPTSTPAFEFIDINTHDLIGTGPFIIDEYNQEIGIKFHRSETYWGGIAAIKSLSFFIIGDIYERNDALQSGIIDFLDQPLDSMLDTFETDPDITLEGGQGTVIHILSMNNNIIDQTMRQAISYAINYTYVINELYTTSYIRLESALPETLKYANWSFNVASLDIIQARQILVDAGVCTFDVYNDIEWLDAAATNPLATYTYTFNIGNLLRENFGLLLQDNLAQIGIDVVLEPLEWWDFFMRFYIDPNSVEMCITGWGSDYNDPYNYINYLYSEGEQYNSAQVSDGYLQDLIEQSIAETDPIMREAIYDEIQRYLVEDLMPYAYIAVNLDYDAYNTKLSGFQWNAFGIKLFYEIFQPTVEVETETGTNVEIEDPVHEVELIFDGVTEAGSTTITVLEEGPKEPEGFEINDQYYEVETTATYSGQIEISFHYDETQVFGDEADLRLMHWNETTLVWDDITTWVDTENNIIYGQIYSLSVFAIIQASDLINPVTKITLSGTSGNDNWFLSSVIVTLTATDDLSGIAKTQYKINEGSWSTYIDPFEITQEGINTLYFRSIDNYGNIEEANEEIIKIDKTVPIITYILSGTDGNEGWFVSDVVIIMDFIEEGSGLKYLEFNIGGSGWVNYSEPITIPNEGIVTFTYRSADVAGNEVPETTSEIWIDQTAPETELVITDCYTNAEGNIYVTYGSTFVVVGFDEHSGFYASYYRINGGSWSEFTESFNLTGDPGEYVIDYYSIDVAGNIEEIKSTTVILETEIAETFEVFGILRVNGQIFVGAATLSISDETIQLEVEDQIATWEIINHVELQNIEIYIGEGETGMIKVILITCGDTTYVLAYGDGVFFTGTS